MTEKGLENDIEHGKKNIQDARLANSWVHKKEASNQKHKRENTYKKIKSRKIISNQIKFIIVIRNSSHYWLRSEINQ